MGRPTGLGEASLRTERLRSPAVTTQPPVATGSQLADIDLIAPNPRNPKGRMLTGLDELAASITAVGILQPLLLTSADEWLEAHPEDTVEVAGRAWVAQDGHRRLAAATLVGATQVPYLARGVDVDESVLRVTTAYHAARLTPMEEATNFASLIERGLSQSEISRQTGISQGHISNRLKMLSLPDAVQAAVDQGRVGVQEALSLSRNADNDLIARVGTKVAEAETDDAAPQLDLNTIRLEAEADRRHEEAIGKAQSAAAELGGEFVANIADRIVGDPTRHLLHSQADKVAAATKGNLLVTAARRGAEPEFYATQLERHTPAESAADREARLRREADAARTDALYRAAEKTPPTSLLQQTLTMITLRGLSLTTGQADHLAHKLAIHVGLTDKRLGTQAWRGTLLDLLPAEQTKAAWIVALAILESYTALNRTGWGTIQRYYSDLLAEVAGYTTGQEI